MALSKGKYCSAFFYVRAKKLDPPVLLFLDSWDLFFPVMWELPLKHSCYWSCLHFLCPFKQPEGFLLS